MKDTQSRRYYMLDTLREKPLRAHNFTSSRGDVLMMDMKPDGAFAVPADS